jgi:predicted negative regulator of RcsB-dependent stress response
MKNGNKAVEFINIIKKNKTTFFTIVGFIILVGAFTIFTYTRFQMLNANSSTKLAAAAKYISGGQTEQGMQLIDDVISQYSRTPSSYRARLMKANYLITQKKYEEAELLVKTVISQARPETVKPLAYPVLIAIYDEAGNIEKAISASNEFLAKYKKTFWLRL